MTIPVPSLDLDKLPSVAELEARGEHARHLRAAQPGITDREILDAWDGLGDGKRRAWLLAASMAINGRAMKPGVPDDPDRLRARLGDAR